MLYFEMLRTDADVLLRETVEYTRQERLVTARLLVRLAAVEERELYADAGHATMWDYCLGELGMSDDAAGRRLWAARKCREFPALFDALADGRIALTAVHTLATYLRPETVDELIAAATGRSKSELKDWLACRFPRPAVPTRIEPVRPANEAVALAEDTPALTDDAPAFTNGAPALTNGAPALLLTSEHAAEVPATSEAIGAATVPAANANGHVANSHALARVPVLSSPAEPASSPVPLTRRAHVDPLNADEVKVSFTMPRRVLAKMQHAMDLLGHTIAPHDVAALFERLLDMGTPKLERQKFAATDQPRAPRVRKPGNARTIPADVRRAVWKRDHGRCTFEAANGRRCSCRRGLQFDHEKPVALGGESTVKNVRLLCPKHNQLEAERRLGKELMTRKRAEARQAAAARKDAGRAASEGNAATARASAPARRPRTIAHDPAPDRLPPIKAPHEDQLRATLTAWGHPVSEISIGLCAALRLSPEAGYDARLDAALEALRRRGAA